MPPQDTESQFKFLLACIKHSVAGKINFGAVAEELGIVSKAAAAKRYERLLKAHGINMPPVPRGNREDAGGTPSRTPRTPGGRKRKPRNKTEDEAEEDGVDIKQEEEHRTPAKRTKMANPLAGESDNEDFNE